MNRLFLSTLLLLLGACVSPTPTPTPTSMPPPVPSPTPTPYQVGPHVVVFETVLVELVVPRQVRVSEEVLFQLALANVGDETMVFFHKADLAEFVLSQDGQRVMSSHDQLLFADITFENRLGPRMTRRFETGFAEGTFLGVLIGVGGAPLPPGEYQVHGIARLSEEDDGSYEQYATPPATIEILP